MAFSSTGLIGIVDNGVNGGGPSIWHYRSSDNSTDIAFTPGSTDLTGLGYLAGVGYGGRGPGTQGLRIGDLVVCVATTAALIPGETVWMSVIQSSENVLSTAKSSGFGASYDVSIGGFGNSTIATT